MLTGVFYPARAQDPSSLPLISRLDTRDLAFRQYLADVESSRRSLFNRNPAINPEMIVSSLTIYTYVPGEREDLFAISARCSIPYATLASLNRFSHPEDMAPGKALLLSTVPGIFVPENVNSSLENLLTATRVEGGTGQTIGFILSIPREGRTEKFRFLPGDDFTSTERIFFLNRGFHFPLINIEISSSYGPRVNPVTGIAGMHRGIDFSAPEGSAVYAVKNGTVVDLGEDAVMGKYLILSHDNDWVSFYGHLSVINAVLHEEVQSASMIARVGSTGQSTGPHLHFEIRQNGQNRDPARLLGLFRSSGGR